MTVARSVFVAATLLVLTTIPMCSQGVGGGKGAMALTLHSPAFASSAPLPARYTCDGAAVSPPLQWSGVPAGTKSLALIVDDPDAPDPAAPQRTWVHWVLYDLPPSSTGLAEGATGANLPAGTRQGVNDWAQAGYGAPCPPTGRHRYVFKLHALGVVLADLGKPDKAQLLKAMADHVLAHAELVGTYQRGH